RPQAVGRADPDRGGAASHGRELAVPRTASARSRVGDHAPTRPMPTEPHSSTAPADSGLTEAEARRRLDALGPRGELPTSRSYTSIVRANTLTLFNLILASFL